MNYHIKGLALIALAALMWGTVGIGTRFVGDVNATTISFYRCIIASAALLVMMAFSGKLKNLVPKRGIKYFLLFGITLVIFLILFATSIQTSTIANAVLLFYTAPVFATIFSMVFLKEGIRKQSIVSFGLCMAGIVFISGSGFETNLLIGTLIGLFAGVFYGLNITIGRYLKEYSGYVTSFWENVIAFLILMPFASIFNVQIGSMPALLYLGIVASAFAPFLFLEGIRSVKTQDAGVIMMLDPLTGILWALLVFAEVPNLLTIVGGAFILIAIGFQILSSKK
jgi:drug/metabolite transporter (DMT)-like permease